MDCNKDEAVRAMQVAVKKMQSMDYSAARKIANRARSLCPDLINISQMVSVCDVLCSAEQAGGDTDWYAVLQLHHTADVASIKKQYRRLALLLHPDKNQMPGAEAAFKLVGEAKRLLLDHTSRILYDMKIRSSSKQVDGSAPVNPSRPTFWTICPFCSVKYQYYHTVINHSLECQTCLKSFIAIDINFTAPPPDARFPKTSRSCRKPDKNPASGPNPPHPEKENTEGDHPTETGFENGNGWCAEEIPRAAPQARDKTVYNEISDDSGSEKSSKRRKAGRASVVFEENGGDKGGRAKKEVKGGARKRGRRTSSGGGEMPESYMSPDPQFANFEAEKKAGFKVGQVWAVYDTVDAMPRFYVRISRVLASQFRLRFTWLEYAPDEDGRDPVETGWPVSCGRFLPGEPESSDSLLMFSHLASPSRKGASEAFTIYPVEGETWAVFRDWEAGPGHPARKPPFEFEFLEIVSGFSEPGVVRAARLWKLKGFTTVFARRRGEAEFSVPASESGRFSHRVPSLRLTGEEADRVPAGSFELDSACLQSDLAELEIDGSDASDGPDMDEVKPGPLPPSGPREDLNECVSDTSTSAPVSRSSSDGYVLPDTEFHDFAGEKPEDGFRNGQIWAVYGDEDGLPKYYGRIKMVRAQPTFRVELVWLEESPVPEGVIPWRYKGMPIGCGWFEVKRRRSPYYHSTDTFSHLVTVEPFPSSSSSKREVLAILPGRGETWAMYKNWGAGMAVAHLDLCEYEMAEVVERSTESWQVILLERVDGFSSVFRPREDGSMTVSRAETLRFSHRVPSFRLTHQLGGNVRGFWELDPASLPVFWFDSWCHRSAL